MSHKLVLVGVLLAVPTVVTPAAERVVATSGSDVSDCGSNSAPCATPVYCMNQLSSSGGDVCRVHAGTYVAETPKITQSGTPSAKNTLRAFGDGEVILQAVIPNEQETLLIKAHDLVIRDVTIWNRVRTDIVGNGLEFTHVKFTCPGGGGVGWSNYTSILTGLEGTEAFLTGLWIHDNLFIYDSSCQSQGPSLGSPLSFIHLYSTSGAIIENNDFRVAAAVTGLQGKIVQGIGLKACNRLAQVRYNRIEVSAGELGQAMWLFNNAPGNPQCNDTVLGDNKVYQNVLRASGSGLIGAALFHGQSGAPNWKDWYYNNTVFNAGLCINSHQEDNTITEQSDFNNICYNSVVYHVNWEGSNISLATYMDNNDYYPEGTNKFRHMTTTFTNYAAWKNAVSPKDQSSRTLDPLFVDPSTGDYHLQAGSPMRSGGRGNGYPTVLGAYVSGTESIGCTFDPACSSTSGGSSNQGSNLPPAPEDLVRTDVIP